MTIPTGPRAPGQWEDPGWGKPHLIVLGAFVPRLRARRANEKASLLLATRLLFFSFTSSMIIISLVVLENTSNAVPPGSPSTGVACAIAAVAAVVWVSVGRLVKRTLPCGDVGQILGAYRHRFFLQMAFNNAASLTAFVLTFLSAVPWPYFVGLPVALVGQALAAPTRRHLEAESQAMAAQGCPTTLLGAFAQVTPPAPPTFGT